MESSITLIRNELLLELIDSLFIVNITGIGEKESLPNFKIELLNIEETHIPFDKIENSEVFLRIKIFNFL